MPHKKIRFRWAIACAALFFSGNALADITADHKHTVMTLLLSGNHKDFRTAAMIIQREKLAAPEILDLVAERLLLGASKQNDPDQLATMVHLGRVFEAVPMPRYRHILEQSLQSYSDKSVKEELQKILAAVPADAATSYTAGSLALEKLQSEAAQVSEHNQQEFAGRLRSLPPLGQSMDEVYAALGLPDEVRSIDIPYVRLGNIKAFYYGLGIIQFDYPNDAAPILQVVATMPEVPGAVANYAGPNTQYAHALASAEEKYFRYLVKGGWRLVETDPALVEVLYNKVYALAQTDNKYALDAIVYVLKRLAQTQPAGWNAFLTRLEAKTADYGIRKLVRALKTRSSE